MRNSYNLKIKDYRFIHITKWKIKGFDDYGFLNDNRLFNYKTNRFSKQVVRNYSRGYNLNGKFIILDNLKPLIYKVNLYDPYIIKTKLEDDIFSFLLELS